MRFDSGREPRPPTPALLGKPRIWAIALTILLVPFFVKIPRSLNNHPVIGALGDQLHVVLLGSLTLLLYWKGPLAGRIWQVALTAVVTGGAIELLQIIVGRTALFQDFLLDLLGIGLATAWILWKGWATRFARTAFFVLLLVVPLQMYRVPFVAIAASHAESRFPVIGDFEGPFDGWLWSDNTASSIEILTVSDGPDGPSRVLRFSGMPPDHWPAVFMRRFPRDWSEYSAVSFDVRATADSPAEVRFGVRLDDFIGLKKLEFYRSVYTATDRWQTLTLPIAEVEIDQGGRLFDATDVDKILFYLPRPKEVAGLEIDNIRLTK